MAQTTTKTVVAKKPSALPKIQKPSTAPEKTAAAKPAKKPATTKDAAKKAAPRAAVKGNSEIAATKQPKKAAGMLGGVTPEQRYRMICDAAYYRAERRGFIGGDPAQDWVDAELEIDHLLCDTQAQNPGH